ncbi:MAG: aminopeptidase C [Candidatus Dormibacteraceae bacterium]
MIDTALAGRTLDKEEIEQLQREFLANPAYRLAQNALTRVPVEDVALDRRIVNTSDPTTSTRLDDWTVTNQAHSGRCWLFAGLNLLRPDVMRRCKLKDFEFSQNHAMFWDKLERANYFLESIIETASRDVDDRSVAYLLDSVGGDGGQWNMFVAIVRKHGLVPKAFMPETKSSENTRPMNQNLRTVLRRSAGRLRELARRSPEEARAEKSEVLRTVHRMLSVHLGTPPDRFLWQWTDRDHGFHRDGELTPQEFAERYVDLPIDEYVCLVNDPRPTSPAGRTYTVEFLGNVVEAPPVVYLNVGIEVMRDAALKLLMDGKPVWFGCDSGKMRSDAYGLWDARLLDWPGVYDTDFELTKAERLMLHESKMTHAMLFTGVDVVDGRPRRWRVENSWGSKRGLEGFYTMNDSWFAEHLFEIAVPRSLLAPELQAALEAEPTALPAWDPMGALAG